jgi:hypothetical protein
VLNSFPAPPSRRGFGKQLKKTYGRPGRNAAIKITKKQSMGNHTQHGKYGKESDKTLPKGTAMMGYLRGYVWLLMQKLQQWYDTAE